MPLTSCRASGSASPARSTAAPSARQSAVTVTPLTSARQLNRDATARQRPLRPAGDRRNKEAGVPGPGSSTPSATGGCTLRPSCDDAAVTALALATSAAATLAIVWRGRARRQVRPVPVAQPGHLTVRALAGRPEHRERALVPPGPRMGNFERSRWNFFTRATRRVTMAPSGRNAIRRSPAESWSPVPIRRLRSESVVLPCAMQGDQLVPETMSCRDRMSQGPHVELRSMPGVAMRFAFRAPELPRTYVDLPDQLGETLGFGDTHRDGLERCHL